MNLASFGPKARLSANAAQPAIMFPPHTHAAPALVPNSSPAVSDTGCVGSSGTSSVAPTKATYSGAVSHTGCACSASNNVWKINGGRNESHGQR